MKPTMPFARYLVVPLMTLLASLCFGSDNGHREGDARGYDSNFQHIDNDEKYKVVPFRLNYLIPANYSAKPDNNHFQEYNPNDKKAISSTEVKLQISGKALLADFSSINAAIYGAYTQQSYWQAYQASAYFRETNYKPEIFLSFLSDKHLFGWTLIDAELGFVHQSNGMGGERERSWNRAYLRQIIQKGNFQIETVESLRIKDTKDYNPDIVKFLGNDSLTIGYRTGKFLWSLELRNQISSTLQRGAEIFSLSLPLSKRLNGFIEVFSGYGQCLGEYNHYTNSIGIGICLSGIPFL